MDRLSPLLSAVLLAASLAAADPLPTDPSFWQRLETLPPTPKGTGYLPGFESGQFVTFRYTVPKTRPAHYLVNLDNIVALHGGGTSYRVEIHVDAADGPLLYRGAVIGADHAFNAEDLSRLDATAFLTEQHIEQGYIDVWATAWVQGDKWTTYRDADGSRWDIYALIPEPGALARWNARRRRREALLAGGISIVPQPRRIETTRAAWRVDRTTTIHVEGLDAESARAAVAAWREGFGEIAAFQPRRVQAQADNQIRLVRVPDRKAMSDLVKIGVPPEPGDQGYVLRVEDNGALIVATSRVGLYYGTQTLLQMMRKEGDTMRVPGVRIVDWPDLRKRMVQYDIARGNTVNVDYWKRWIRELSRLKINRIMLYMEDDWKSPKYPFLGRADTFTPEKARILVEYAKKHHLELVPQVESLGHAGALLRHEELADLRLAGGTSAICPRAKQTLPFLNDLFGELADAFPQAELFHIGGDEVWGFAADSRCADMVKTDGEEGVYAFHLNNLHRLLTAKGRRMAFWGDELLKHPRVAERLTRDAVVFDWHYGNQSAYPSIQFFQDLGYEDIYVCPAVHGYFDVYPQYAQAFGNIRGFIRAGVERGVEGVCCTTWGMNRGGNAENYLYGLAYAAECAWSSDETNRRFFDRRFATAWLGIPHRPGLDTDMDRAFWFSWRGEQRSPFWQRLFAVSRMFFGTCPSVLDKRNADARLRLIAQARVLEGLCDEALAALTRLRKQAGRNLATLRALEHAIEIHRYVAGKCLAVCSLARGYRGEYAKQRPGRQALAAGLETTVKRLRALEQKHPALEAGLREGIRERGGDPNDLGLFTKTRTDMATYRSTLAGAAAALRNGEPAPSPGDLGLGPRLSARIGQWGPEDVNPSSRNTPKKLVFEVTENMTAPGTYQVEWDYTRGADGLDIVATSLCGSSATEAVPADLTPVSTDEHHAFTGAADRHNRYTLTADKPVPGTRYFIVGTVYNQRDFETYGTVWLLRDWERKDP